MIKHKILLTLLVVITFVGGFFSGILFSTGSKQNKNLTYIQEPLSEKIPVHKQVPRLQSKVLVSYVQDFRDPDVLNYSKLTHIIFSFAHPTKDGRFLLNGKMALDHLRIMALKAHQYHKKIILGLGGWFNIQGGESYSYFKAALTNPISRTKLVNGLVKMTKREKLDGLDIDYEYPRTKNDAHNLDIFIKELSQKLHSSKKELSIAVNAKVNSVTGTEITNVVYDPAMFKYVDHINIMAYDGQWDGVYNAANLSPFQYNVNIVNYWTRLFDKYQISKEKLVLGIPFYAQPDNPAIKQVSYAAIIHKDPKNANHDIVQMNGTTYHYNGIKSVEKKTKLALENGFGGMMLWEAGLDSHGPDSLTNLISETLSKAELYTFDNK